jgi:hypothetical protein
MNAQRHGDDGRPPHHDDDKHDHNHRKDHPDDREHRQDDGDDSTAPSETLPDL